MPRLNFSQISGPSVTRRNGVAIGAIALVALAIGIIIATLPGATKAASTAGKIAGSTTVERRNLVSTDTEAGTLSYANPQTVFDRLSGTITWLPAVGALVRPGGTLFKVNGSPVVLFNGSTPAYRDLSSSDTSGSDIYELNADLKALGYDSSDPITVDDEWQTATTDAVEAWQNAHGMTETGSITFGQIVFLPGPQRITTVNTVLGSDGSAAGSGSGNGSGSGASLENPLKPRPEYVDLTTTTPSTSTTTPSTTPRTSTTTSSPATPPAQPATQPDVATSSAAKTAKTAAATCNGLDVPQQNIATSNRRKHHKPLLPSCDEKSARRPSNVHGPSPTGSKTPPKKGSKPPTTEAALLALLRAETLELEKSLKNGGAGNGANGGAGGGGANGAGGAGGGKGGGGGGAGGGGAGGGGGSGGGGSGGSGGGGSGSGGSGGGGGSGGSGGGGAVQAILDTTSTQVVVTVDLDATKQSEATVGEPVQVQMPNGNFVNGKITAVSPVAQNNNSGNSGNGGGGGGGNGNTPSASVPVTITLKGHQALTGLDQAAVSVNFQQQKANNVLSVPVTALIAVAGGGYAVQEAAAPHRILPVTPGLFAAGYVQISGTDIYPGLQVTDSQG